MFSHMIILLQSFYLFVGVWLISTFFFFFTVRIQTRRKKYSIPLKCKFHVSF